MSEEERIKKGFLTRTEIIQERTDKIVEDELWKKAHKSVITVIE